MIEFAAEVQPLWTVHKHGREASASVRAFTFSRELRVIVGSEPVFTRPLRNGDDGQGLGADLLRTFLNDGWTVSPDTENQR